MRHSLLRANLAYMLGSGVSGVVQLLLIPYLVKALTPEQYGAWALIELIITLVGMFMLAGLDVGLMRDYWFLESQEVRDRLVGTLLITLLVWGAGIGLLILALPTSWIHSLVPVGPGILALVLAAAWAETLFALLLTVLRIREKATAFAGLSAGRLALFLALAVALVNGGHGLAGAVVGRLVATLVGLLAAALWVGRISLKFDWGLVRSSAAYGLPLLPTGLASYILLASDRLVLQHFASLEIVAVYSFAYKLAGTLDLAITRPFANDWGPRRFKIAASANAPQTYGRILVLYVYAAVLFALLVLAAAPTAYALFAPPVYLPGLTVLPIILAAYIVFGLSYPLNIGIMLRDRTRYLPLIGSAAAIVCLALTWWSIPKYGMLGAAWSTLIAYGVWTAGITWYSLKLYPMSYAWRQLGLVVAAALAGCLGIWGIRQFQASANPWLLLALQLGWLLAVFGAAGCLLWRNETGRLPWNTTTAEKAGAPT